MRTTYRQRRKDLANLYQLRELIETLHRLEDTVIDISNPEVYAEVLVLRSQVETRLQSAIADIPWFCKVMPIQ